MTQEEALRILKTGANVFLTGEPGSGKTHTINEYTRWLRTHGIEPAITASTGIAATHIGGSTIHSWSGIGIKETLTDEDADRLAQNERLVSRALSARVLILDEVSMLSAHTLTMVDIALRALTGRPLAFGGLQVVFVGDFFQLPPIKKRSVGIHQELFDEDSQDTESIFAFASPAWRSANPIVCYLHEQHRQEDSVFLEILSSIRKGNTSHEHKEILKERVVIKKEELLCTQLYAHNADVDRVNEEALSALPGFAKKYQMKSYGSKSITEQLIRGCLSPEILALKEGARVMFTKNNFEAGYVNGTTGVVIDFDREGYPIVETHDGSACVARPVEWVVSQEGKRLGAIEQIPLRLAWAITVHKSQGMSLDAAHIDLTRAFEYGQGYVALSRVRSLSGLSLGGLNERAFLVHPDIIEKDTEFREASELARDTFAQMEHEEIEKMHEQFIQAVGGTLVPKEIDESSYHAPRREEKESTTRITLTLFNKGLTIDAIAKERGLTVDTILSHIETLMKEGSITKDALRARISDEDGLILRAEKEFMSLGTQSLKKVFESSGGDIPYRALKIARMLVS